MRTAEQWLFEYARTHQNPQNKKIHKVCVPVIFWSVFAFLWTLPPLGFMQAVPYLNWATVILLFTLGFYLTLGLVAFFDMVLFSALTFSLILVVEKAALPLAQIAIGAFVLAWIGQFYGHKLEGKKPAFLDDLLFLLIGPLWIVNGLKRRRER